MKNFLREIIAIIITTFFLINCTPQKNIALPGTTWIYTDVDGDELVLVSFIDDKIVYIIQDYIFTTYDYINVGTRSINGENDKGEWRNFTYSMENGILTLNLPDRLNPKKHETQFSRRLVGNNNGQPIGIWTNDTGEYFYFTNSEITKKWTIGSYVSWDYVFDNDFITWSGNKNGGKLPYRINNETEQLTVTLPGNVTPSDLRLVSNKFVIIF